MKKLFNFLMVGLAFVLLQTATVEAQQEDCAGMSTPAEVAACWERQAPAAPTSAGTETPIRAQLMKTAILCREEVTARYAVKRKIHFGTASPPFPPMGADGKDNERIDAQEQIQLEKCYECPTMWSVADKSQENGVPGTHIGSGTVTCMTPAEAAVAPGTMAPGTMAPGTMAPGGTPLGGSVN